MSKMVQKYWLFSSTILGAILSLGNSAIATEATKSQIADPVIANESGKIQTSLTTQLNAPTVIAVETGNQGVDTREISNNSEATLTSQNSVNSNSSEKNGTIIDQFNNDGSESDSNALEQVTNVSQLRDVSPGDWAYEALRSLVERYGCIAGYPDGTFRGNRAMTRYEFAAGLNACLNQLERLTSGKSGGIVDNGDLASVRRLMQEFQAELQTLVTKVDNLEGRVAVLEDRQFSATTKLNAAVIFALAGVAGGENARGGNIDKVTAFGDRVRLNFDTSFTGKDLLRTRLLALNLGAFSGTSTFTPEGDLRFGDSTFGTGGGNNVEIDALLYQFSLGEKTNVVIEANAAAPDDFTNTVNPYFDGDGDSGAISNFATRNPIYDLVGGTGIGIKHEFSDALELSLGYLAPDTANSGGGKGLFNGPYGALAQLTVKPLNKLTIGLTYVHAYNTDFTAGSNRANLRTALADNSNLPTALQAFGGLSIPTSSNAYTLQASFQVSPKLVIGGWLGYTATRTLSTAGGILDRGDLKIWNWAVTLAAPDLGKEGSVAGIIVGMEPKVTDVSNGLKGQIGADSNTSLHIEAFYQYKLTDNISITPGIIWLTAPDHNSSNNDIVIGAIRTTFTF